MKSTDEMKSTDDLMRQLALADPAKDPATNDLISADSESARALLHRITAEPVPLAGSLPARRRSLTGPDGGRLTRNGRRFALGAGLLATATAVAIAGVITTPWSHGRHAASAYAIEQNADGSLQVAVHFDELRDPAALNQEMARHHARTVVMPLSAPGACHSSVLTDPRYSMPLQGHGKIDVQKEQRDRSPWLTYPIRPVPSADGYELFTIHPDKVPAGDQLLVMYAYLPTQRPDGSAGDDALMFSSVPVLSLPECIPATVDQVIDGRTGQIHPR